MCDNGDNDDFISYHFRRTILGNMKENNKIKVFLMKL